MSDKPFRVLLIPSGQKVDADGLDLGDNWPLVHVLSGDAKIFVTTANVPASDLHYVLARALGENTEERLAEFIADALNRAFADHPKDSTGAG